MVVPYYSTVDSRVWQFAFAAQLLKAMSIHMTPKILEIIFAILCQYNVGLYSNCLSRCEELIVNVYRAYSKLFDRTVINYDKY